MSVRTSGTASKGHHAGSIFGSAVGVQVSDLWAKLAVSPPRSPPKTAMVMLAPPSFSLNAQMGETQRSASHLVVEAVCPTAAFDFGGDIALVVFNHEVGSTMTLQSHPRRVVNVDPVVARPIAVDSVTCRRMHHVENSGFVFSLSFRGAHACKIEVVASQTETRPLLQRVSVIQSCYAPIVVSAGLADRSSMLVYDKPAAHVTRLEAVRNAMATDPELCYLPTSECCVTRNIDALTLETNDPLARQVWRGAKDFLKSMSTVAADCTDLHARREVNRVSAYELRDRVSEWRRHVS